ncbi:MAG: enoyl-ACP reductase FabI [Dokdonella sp.]
MDIVSVKGFLAGKRGLVVGIANDCNIAWGCAQAYRAAGAEIAVTWLNEKARSYVEPLAQAVQAGIALPLDVRDPAQIDALFAAITQRWGQLDFLLHAVAYAPSADLHGRLTDSSVEGFLQAMDISCHSFVRLARKAEPLMQEGGSLVTLSYLGAEDAIANYGLMGPVKAALESVVRYLAVELGPRGIRVNAISPGPVATRAASGLASFDRLLVDSAQRAPLPSGVSIEDVGALSAFLASDGARAITGDTLYVDAGLHILN